MRPDFGVYEGVLAELAEILAWQNGFAVCNSGIWVYRVGDGGLGPDLQTWNLPTTWKDTYGTLAENLFCFAQDLFGVQYAIADKTTVVRFNPETAERTVLGQTLENWAQWLLEDLDVRAAYSFATAWQDEHGPLEPDQRLIPQRPFVLGGTYEADNLAVKEATTCMRIRGPIAQEINDRPDGTLLHLRA